MTFRIFRLFNLSFRTNFNDCLACRGDDWISNVFCDMTVLWIYIISGCSNCFTSFTLRTLIWCTKVFFNIFNVFHFWFNQRFYYFILSRDFNYCFGWIYYYWIYFIWNNFPIVWIYCISRCGGLTPVFSWDSNIILTFFATSIFFIFYWGWDCFYFYFIFHPIFLEYFIKCIFSNLSRISIFHTHSC